MAKRSPERMCVVCRQMRKKSALLRVVKTAQGDILYDPTGKAPGRGAYICAERECFSRLPKTKGFERAFKCSIPDSVFDAVSENIAGDTPERL